MLPPAQAVDAMKFTLRTLISIKLCTTEIYNKSHPCIEISNFLVKIWSDSIPQHMENSL